jgi:hypothetical protein
MRFVILEGRKGFFFEKKNQKTFAYWGVAVAALRAFWRVWVLV